MSQQSFADLGVSAPVRGALAARGMEAPFAIQSLVIADVLAGHDVLAKSPTGSGKTLAFGIPVVERAASGAAGPSALVLVPTRELASQVTEEIRAIAHARGLRITAVYGGVSISNQARVVRRADILVATPGRLEDLHARRLVALDGVRILVLDEADRMLDMGFQPQVDRIVRLLPAERQTLFFSATLDGEAGRLAAAYTRHPRTHVAEPMPQPIAPIEHRFAAVAHETKVDALVGALAPRDVRAIVFVRTKRGAERLAKKLEASGIEAVAMHGDKTQAAREKALARFESGRVDTLVATDVAARGIDVESVTHVVNFDAPEDREGYVHRTGRTGRAGRSGIALTFVMDDQVANVAAIVRELSLEQEWEAAGFPSRPARPSAPARRRGPAGPPRPTTARSTGNGTVWSGRPSSRSGGRGRPRAGAR